jgi:hypothetical protein
MGPAFWHWLWTTLNLFYARLLHVWYLCKVYPDVIYGITFIFVAHSVSIVLVGKWSLKSWKAFRSVFPELCFFDAKFYSSIINRYHGTDFMRFMSCLYCWLYWPISVQALAEEFLTFLPGTPIKFGSKLQDPQFSFELIMYFLLITLLLYTH